VLALRTLFVYIFGTGGGIPTSIEGGLVESLVDSADHGTTADSSTGGTDEVGMGDCSATSPNLSGKTEGDDGEKDEDCECSHSSRCSGSGYAVGVIGHGTPQPHDSTPEPGNQSSDDD